MIWYRHWLELRRPLMLLVSLTVLSGYLFNMGLHDELGQLSASSGVRRGIARGFGTLVGSIGPVQVVTLGVHAQATIFAMLLAFVVLCGNGLRVVEVQSGLWSTGGALPVRAAAYTLSLPISRSRLILSRLAAGYAGGVVVLASYLAAHALAIGLAGHEVPLRSMIMVSFVGSLAMLFWMSVLAAIKWRASGGIGSWLVLLIALLTATPVYVGMGKVAADYRELWTFLPGTLVAIAAAVGLTIAVARTEEF